MRSEFNNCLFSCLVKREIQLAHEAERPHHSKCIFIKTFGWFADRPDDSLFDVTRSSEQIDTS